MFIRDAVLDRRCAENPAARVKLPRFERPLIVPLTIDQIAALENAIEDRCRALVTVQAGAGLRIGELLALRVASYRLSQQREHDYQRADMAMRPWVLRLHREWRRHVQDERATAATCPTCLTPANAHRPGHSQDQVQMNSASHLLAAGVSVVTVVNRLGRADPGVTLKVYAHLIADQDEPTRMALEAAWGRSSVRQRSRQDRSGS